MSKTKQKISLFDTFTGSVHFAFRPHRKFLSVAGYSVYTRHRPGHYFVTSVCERDKGSNLV